MLTCSPTNTHSRTQVYTHTHKQYNTHKDTDTDTHTGVKCVFGAYHVTSNNVLVHLYEQPVTYVFKVPECVCVREGRV